MPALDKVLQPSTGAVLGPLWVTKGEIFSPKGAHNFLSTMVLNTKERLKSSKQYINEVSGFKILSSCGNNIIIFLLLLRVLQGALSLGIDIKCRKHFFNGSTQFLCSIPLTYLLKRVKMPQRYCCCTFFRGCRLVSFSLRSACSQN